MNRLFFIGFFLFSGLFCAAQKDMRTVDDDRRNSGYVGVALVVGNSDYGSTTQIKSPVKDATDMAKVFRELGFKVLTPRINATLQTMEAAISEFESELSANKGVGVFYFSGHGVQSKGMNYLLPVDAEISSESILGKEAIKLESVIATMERATPNPKIIILDAGRDVSFQGWSAKGGNEKGLAKIDAPAGMLIAFATTPNQTAAESEGLNSAYTEVLLGEIKRPLVSIVDLLFDVRNKLIAKNGQISWENSSLREKFCFAGCGNSNSGSVREPVESVLERIRNPQKGQAFANFLGMEFVGIPAGSFVMGSPESETLRSKDEGPQRRVTFSKGFWLGKYEVTQAEYQKVMGTAPSDFKNCPKCPVENVSWDDAKAFIAKLNARNDGYVYSLPTEAEWEYAARAGTTGPFGIGDGRSLSSNDANFDGNYPYGNAPKGRNLGKTTPVGSYKPNAFGLHDMHGNVWEWCEDIYQETFSNLATDGSANQAGGSDRVIRGGAWNGGGSNVRSANRVKGSPGGRDLSVGFRVAVRFR